MNWILQHKLVFIIAIVVIVAGVWFGLSQSGSPAPLLTTETVTTNGGTADKGLVGTLLALRAVTLSGTIFTEPAFMSLQDFGTTIVPEPVGRDNPFAPLSSQVTTTTTPRAAQIFAPRR